MFLNWPRTSCAVSITTVVTWRSVSQFSQTNQTARNTTFWHNLIKRSLINKISQKVRVRYSELNLNIRRQLFYSSIPAEAVTIAVTYPQGRVISQLMLSYEQKKLNLLNKQCFYQNSEKSQKLQQAVFRPWHRPTIVFALVYCPVDNTMECNPGTRKPG